MPSLGNPSQTTSHFCEKSHELKQNIWKKLQRERDHVCYINNTPGHWSRGKGGKVAGLAAIVYNTSIQPKANTHIDIL